MKIYFNTLYILIRSNDWQPSITFFLVWMCCHLCEESSGRKTYLRINKQIRYYQLADAIACTGIWRVATFLQFVLRIQPSTNFIRILNKETVQLVYKYSPTLLLAKDCCEINIVWFPRIYLCNLTCVYSDIWVWQKSQKCYRCAVLPGLPDVQTIIYIIYLDCAFFYKIANY